MFKDFIKRTFDLRDGEIFISFLMQFYIFIIITVLLIVKPTINALFLSNLGAGNLPYGYLLVALTAILSSYFYNKAIHNFSIKKVTIPTLVVFSVFFLILSLLLYFKLTTDWIFYIFYLVVSLFAVLATSQFWIIANLVYNVREAKRLFGFIGAGAIAGGVFGGYLTSILAPWIGNKGLLLIAALLLLLCIPILRQVWRIRINVLTSYERKQRKSLSKSSYRSSFKIVIQSRHLTYLASIIGVGVIIAKLVDFQFSDFANRAIPDSDKLASFFGFWFSTFNVIAFLLQLFFTNRILSYLGVASALLILPLGIALGCLLFLTFPELWVLILIKGMDGSFKQSINKAATELSILPIPFDIRNQAKSYIDVVIDSVATGISGFLLIFVIKKLDLDTNYITIIILLLLFLWIVLIYQLREAYFNSFRNNIKNSLVSTKEQRSVLAKETTIGSARRILAKGSDSDITAMLDRLSTFKLKPLKNDIIALLDHPNHKIKAIAIKHLYAYNKGTAIEKIKKLVYVEDDELAYAAMEYLLLHTDLDNSLIFNQFLDHKSGYIANAALLCLAKESFGNSKIRFKYGLERRIKEKIDRIKFNDTELRDTEVAEILITIAYSGMSKYYSIISAHFYDPEPYVVKHAIRAAGITKSPIFIENLIEFLADRQYRKRSIRALINYGEGIIATIKALDKREDLKDRSKRFVPKVIEAFKTQDAVNTLLLLSSSKDIIIRLASSKSLVRLKQRDSDLVFNQRRVINLIQQEIRFYKNSIRAIHIIQSKRVEDETVNPEVNLDISIELDTARAGLIELLHEQSNKCIATIFKLLSLIHEKKDMDAVYSGLINPSPEAKVNAIEFLDNLIHIRLKGAVLPILESQIVQQHPFDFDQLKLKIINEKKCLRMLLKNRGKRIKLAIINLIQFSADQEYLRDLYLLQKHKSREVQQMATKAISVLKS